MKKILIAFSDELIASIQEHADLFYDGNYSMAVRKLCENKLKESDDEQNNERN